MKKLFQAFVFNIFLISTAFAQGGLLEEAFRAALDGNLPGLQKLVERGVEADSTDPEGNSLLMLAARGGHRPVIEFLLERKASVTRRNKFGDSPLLIAAVSGSTEVAGLLLARGAQLQPEGWTPLHYATFAGQAAMVKYLLSKGANKDALAPNGFTALMLAARGGHLEAARVLLFEDPDVNHRTEDGQTALKIAIQRDQKPMADLLRRAGAVE